MNECEALEKIIKICRQYPYITQSFVRDIDHIATQALAPQEPQQKTFTLEEIKENVSKIILKYHRKQSFNLIKDLKVDLLAEFEKAVG